jgi:enoyl-CoA hydratase/carnithine racemase
MSEGVVLSEPGVIWRVALNRPAARNALSSQMREALLRALSDAVGDPDCRVVVLGGVGTTSAPAPIWPSWRPRSGAWAASTTCEPST